MHLDVCAVLLQSFYSYNWWCYKITWWIINSDNLCLIISWLRRWKYFRINNVSSVSFVCTQMLPHTVKFTLICVHKHTIRISTPWTAYVQVPVQEYTLGKVKACPIQRLTLSPVQCEIIRKKYKYGELQSLERNGEVSITRNHRYLWNGEFLSLVRRSTCEL